MNILIKHIEYLLSRRECVIIPGFGGILAHKIDARIVEADGGKRNILPPSRTFTFNRDLSQSDGMLACSIARSLNISYENANSTIDANVEALRNQLLTQGEVAVGRIGSFTYDKHTQAIEFRTYDTDRISIASAWLKPVTVNTVTQQARTQNKVVAQPQDRKPVRVRHGFVIRRVMRTAASIAAVIGLCFILSTPIAINDATLASLVPNVQKIKTVDLLPSPPGEFASVSPERIVKCNNDSKQQTEAVSKTAAAQPSVEISSEQATVASTVSDTTKPEANQKAEVATPAKTTEAKSMPVSINDSDSYCVIVASLATNNDANKFISQHRGANLRILEKEGKYRIYAATANSSAQAAKIAKSAEFSKKYPGAWVCKK